MSTTELRERIVHRLADISDVNVLEEINAMLDSQISEQIFRCTEEQRKVINLARQAVGKGENISNGEMKKAVELCLSGS